MLAPSKSDRGQLGSDRPEGSSSEFDEEDTPLAARLNSQGTSRPKNAGRQRLRPVKTKIAGFVIPRKKKAANELLQASNFNTREGKELLRNVVQSYRDPNAGTSLKFEKLELVFNDQLSREYQEKKLCLKNEGRNPRELEDKYAFRYTPDRNEAKKICQVGLEVRSAYISCLGDPSMGVYLSRHADLISRKPLPTNALGYLIVFKVIKGKVKQVTERTAISSADLLEPTPNFDCHVSRSIQNLPANTPLSQIYEFSQYYFYEFAEEGEELHVKRPRQCLPYALLAFTYGNPSTSQELSVSQNEVPAVENSGLESIAPSLVSKDTRNVEKTHGRSKHVLWLGKIANKDRILADVKLISHSLEAVKLPFEIGERIVMKEKISFQQLRPFLTFPLFCSGPPAISKTCKASLAGGTTFLHCDLMPVEDKHGKITKLVKFFQERNWAGIVKCPDANRVIFLIPTSQITLDLGITTVDSPASLHVLLFCKKARPSKATRTRESREVKTVSQIQEELKRQFSDVKEAHALADLRRLSLESAKPMHASTSSANMTVQESYGSELSNVQVESWKNAVEKWISRPNPLGGSVYTAADSANRAQKTGRPSAVNLLNASPQVVLGRSSSITEGCNAIPAEQFCDMASRQVSTVHALPLPVRKEEHREDPRLKRHPFQTEPTPEFETPDPPASSYSMPYNAQEVLAAQGVTVTSTSDKGSATSSSSVDTHVQYQVDGKSLKNILNNILQPQRAGIPGFQVNVDDGTRKALELLKHGGDSQGKNSALHDDGIKSGPDTGGPNRQHCDLPVDSSRGSLEELKQQQEPQRGSSDVQNHGESTKDSTTAGKSTTSIIATSGEKSVEKNVVNGTDDKGNIGMIDGIMEKQAGGCSESRKGKRKAKPEKRKCDKAKATKPKKVEKQSPVSDSPWKPFEPSVVPELVEEPFPAISSETLEKLKSPPTNSDGSRKATKLKLILSKSKTVKETFTPPLPERNNLAENKLDDQPAETKSKRDEKDKASSGDIAKERKPIGSPVAMDISPVHTTPDPSSTVSPITVVSSKGRYNQAVLSTLLPLTAAHSSQGFVSPVSSGFSFSPPLPQGPYRSPISPVLPPMPFASPLASSVPCSFPASSLPCVTLVSSVSSSVGSMPLTPLSQTVHAPPLPSEALPTCVPPPPPQAVHVPPPPPQTVHVPPPPLPPLPPPQAVHVPPPPPPPQTVHVPPPHSQTVNVSPPPSQGVHVPLPPSQTVHVAPLLTEAPHVPLPPPQTVHVSPLPSQTVHVLPLPPQTVHVLPLPPQTVHVLPLPPSGNASFQVPPLPLHAGNVERNNSTDSIAIASSAASVSYPPALPGLPMTSLPSSQGFGFNQPFSALSRPVLPSAVVGPPVPQFGSSPQLTPPRPPPEVPVVQSAFLPTTAPRFPVPQVSLQGAPVVPPQGPFVPLQGPVMTSQGPQPLSSRAPPALPLYGVTGSPQMTSDAPTTSSLSQFMCPTSLQQPSSNQCPVGFWVAPYLNSWSSCQRHHSPGKKHSKESVVTKSSHRSSELKNALGNKKSLKNEVDQLGGKLSDGGSKENSFVPETNKDKVNAGIKKLEEAVGSQQDLSADSDSAVGIESTTNESGSVEVAAIEESCGYSAKEEMDVKDPDKKSKDHTEKCVQRPEEQSLASTCITAKQNLDINVENPCSEDSGFKGNGLTKEGGSLSSRTHSSVDQVTESRSCNFQDASEVCDLPASKVNNFAESRDSSSGFDNNTSLPSSLTDYITEAEQMSTKARSKIFDILRRNAYDSRSELELTDQGEEQLDELDKPDDPDFGADAAFEEGVGNQGKLIFSGEESTASEDGVRLGSGLRVVQVLDLGGSESEKEKEKIVPECSTVLPKETADGGKNTANFPAELPKQSNRDRSHQRHCGHLPKSSGWEDISDASDEGTPERDLPRFGSVDIEFKQLWTKTAEVPPEAFSESGASSLALPKGEDIHVEEERPTSSRDQTSHVKEPSLKRRRVIDSSSTVIDKLQTSARKKIASSPKKKRQKESPDQSSAKKAEKDRRQSDEKPKRLKEFVVLPGKLTPPSRVVSDTKEGSLKITIVRDNNPDGDVKVTMEDSPETPEYLKENLLADIEYSDLEDISPGRLSLDNERPATPDTPETATPAPDFTHPSLGFWVAPLCNNEMAKPAAPFVVPPMITDDCETSDADALLGRTPLPYVGDQTVTGKSHLLYSVEEGRIHDDSLKEPFIAPDPWPVKGFFSQTTTSEERDLNWALAGMSEVSGEGIAESSYGIEDTLDPYNSMSSHGSEDETIRYPQEHLQSEVFEYGHGKSNQQHKLHRSAGHNESRSIHKEYKHRSTTRVSRYPWKSSTGKKRQLVSPGGEGQHSADQSATGKSTGSKESTPTDDEHAVKRCKLERSAQNGKHETSPDQKTSSDEITSADECFSTEQPRQWDIMVFAWMNKHQFSNWLQRKQHRAKLASDAKGKGNPVVYTPEAVRRSSERVLRRVKMRIRQSSRSSSKSPAPVEIQTTEHLNLDSDELDHISDPKNFDSGQKEVNQSCISKEPLQDNMLCSPMEQSEGDTICPLVVNGEAENCTVDRSEHSSMFCTVEKQDVHKNVDVNVSDVSKEADTVESICCKEVSEILEGCGTQGPGEQADSKFLHDSEEGEILTHHGQVFNVQDPATGCRDMDVDIDDTCNSTSVYEHDSASKDCSTKLLDPVLDKEQPHLDIDSQGNVIVELDGFKYSDKNDKGQADQNTDQASVSNDRSLVKGEVTGNDVVLGKEVEVSPKQVKSDESNEVQGLELPGEIVPAIDVSEIPLANNEAATANNIGDVSKIGVNQLAKESVSLSGKLDEKEESKMDTEEAKEDLNLSVTIEKSSAKFAASDKSGDKEWPLQESVSNCLPPLAPFFTNAEKEFRNANVSECQPETVQGKSANEDLHKPPVATQSTVVKGGESNAANASNSPLVISSVFSSGQLSQFHSSANYSSQKDLNVHFPSSQQFSFAAPMGPSVAVNPVLLPPPQLPPPPPPRLIWPGVMQTGPFPTMPVHSLMQQLPNDGSYSWANHAPSVPCSIGQSSAIYDDICPPGTEDEHQNLNLEPPISSQVGLAWPALVCDDICPPGTEDEHPKLSGEPLALVPDGCAQSTLACDHICPAGRKDGGPNPGSNPVVSETRNVLGNSDGNQPHVSVMDHSMVNALMEFYSEISEVERSENESDKDKLDNEEKTGKGFPKSLALKQMSHNTQELSDVALESDLDDSHMDICGVYVSEIEEVDNYVAEPVREECIGAQVEHIEMSVKESTPLTYITDSAVDMMSAKNPAVSSTLNPAVDAMATDITALCGGLASDPAPSVTNPGDGTNATQTVGPGASSCLGSAGDVHPVESPSVESPSEMLTLSPIDPLFLSNAEHTIFSSIGDLSNLLGQSSSFDRIAEEAITSTVNSLEEVLCQAQRHYVELSSCPSDSGVSGGEEAFPVRISSSDPVPVSPVQGSAREGHIVTSIGVSEEASTTVVDKQFLLKTPRKKFRFCVYTPEHDRECEAVKNYMLKAGGALVDIKDSTCLEEHALELKVLIRRKHLKVVHRLANLYHLKMSPCVKFALFNTSTDVTGESRSFENVFVCGGALLADDVILKTIEIDTLDAMLRFMKKQSLLHQKFVWVLKISRNGYKKLSMNRPLTKRDSEVLTLVRRYKDQGFINILPKGYVTDSIPATQRYLHTTLKLQIELISVYRHIILLSDMEKTRVEVPWFLERGIGVMNIQEFLTTFSRQSEAKNLLAKRPQKVEGCSKETSTGMDCFTPEDETAVRTPDSTPVSDGSVDSPVTDPRSAQCGGAQPKSTVPQKSAVRSLGWNAGTMTQTRLQILSCVRSVRDNIRSQIGTSNPSSPVGRSV